MGETETRRAKRVACQTLSVQVYIVLGRFWIFPRRMTRLRPNLTGLCVYCGSECGRLVLMRVCAHELFTFTVVRICESMEKSVSDMQSSLVGSARCIASQP